MKEIGIDEAGKGPVIGSMFVAGVLNFEGLEEMDVKDSKRLSPAKREYLAKRIEEATEFYVLEMTASEIDEGRKKHTLNEIMVELFSKVIKHFQPDRALVDAADVNPERFAARLRSNCEAEGAGEIEIISECKADERYPLVSAASIIAKVHRDRSIRELEAEIGAEIGSGYPADQKTMQFLKELLKEREMDDLPYYVRQSWKTIDLYIPKLKEREMVTPDSDKDKGKHKGGEGNKEETAYGEEIKECPECGSKNLIRDYGKAELFCANCGLVVAENIVDLGPEWRAFDFEQVSRRARVGAPMTYRIHDKGLSTLVTWCPAGQGQYKLKRWQQRTHIANTTERSFIFALSEIDRMACALRLPMNIREAASMLYRKAMKKRLIRGRSIEGIATAILYITCRQYGVPRTLEEVRDISRVGQKEISRAYRFLLRELDLKVSPASPIDFVPRFCSLLNLSSEIRSKAIEIIKHAAENELTNGRGPIGIAAAAIYIAAILGGEHRTQKEVSDVTGVTEVTIRNRYKELSEQLNIDVLL